MSSLTHPLYLFWYMFLYILFYLLLTSFSFHSFFTWHETCSTAPIQNVVVKALGTCLLWLNARPIQPWLFVFMFTEKTLFSLLCDIMVTSHAHPVTLLNTLPLTLFCHCTNIIVFFFIFLFQKLN